MKAAAEAVEAGDPAALRIAAHTLKGSLRYFGNTVVADYAFTLEKMGRAGGLSGTRQILADLQREVARLVPQLENYLQQE